MMNKKMMILSCILGGIFAMGSVALAVESATINASATITAPTLTLSNLTAMNFGGIVTGTDAASTIVLDSSSNTDATPALLGGTATLNGAGNSGSITVDSNIDATLDISCTNVQSQNDTNTTPGSGDESLEAYGDTTNTIPLTMASVTNYTPVTLDVTGGTPATLYVGGLISVVNGLPEGSYSGTVTIDVAY